MEDYVKRLIIKLSGEVLATGKGYGIYDEFLMMIAKSIQKIQAKEIQIGVVIGAGNFWRGRENEKMERAAADSMGMLGTIMNSVALSDALNRLNVTNRIVTAIGVDKIGELFNRDYAIRYLNEGEVLILAGGTGSPFFSTDSGAALRAAELKADCILMAKKIDGVYDKDPLLHKNAHKFDHLTYQEVLDRKLGVMDLTAITLCMENNIPIKVFSLEDPDNIVKVIEEAHLGTTITA